MTVKRDTERFKRLYPDKRAIIPPEYSKEEITEYDLYSTAGRFKIKVKEGLSDEQKSSSKA